MRAPETVTATREMPLCRVRTGGAPKDGQAIEHDKLDPMRQMPILVSRVLCSGDAMCSNSDEFDCVRCD